MNANYFYEIFRRQIEFYHIADSIDAPTSNPFADGSFENLLWEKGFVDTVQWHLEDIVRPDDVDPATALAIKRRIDRSNQRRTDLVEQIDDRFLARYAKTQPLPDATINTETPAWAVDRLSILALKIYHFGIEASRTDASDEHKAKCQAKLDTLLEQRSDLTQAIDTLLSDLASGRKVMKLYRQMKMYNDPSLNPALYGKK